MTELLEVIDARIERSAAVYDSALDELVGLHGELERLAAIRELAAGLDAPVEEETPDAPPPAAALVTEAAAPTPDEAASLAAGSLAAPKAPKPAPAATAKASKPAPAPPAPGASGELVLEALRNLGETTPKEIAEKIDRTPATVKSALYVLRDQGLAKHNGKRATGSRWLPVGEAPPVRRTTGTVKPLAALLRDVNATIVNDPGLTEQQIAQALSVEREDVAVATGELLAREWIELRPDGTYEPADDTAEEPLAA